MIHETDLSKLMSQYVQGSEHPDLQVYRTGMLDPTGHSLWFWRTKHFCDLGDFYWKRILEVGCGFGWDAVGIAVVGNNEVVASDILPSMVDGMTQCLDANKAAGNPLNVTPLQGDICRLELPDASFDGIFSTEAIEHVHDLGEMFDNCYRLLKPGGTAVIVNDSNRYNEASRFHSWGSWAERDDCWEHVEWLKREVRPVEHADAKPYGVMRQEMIRATDSSLDDVSVAELRKATAGMIRPEIEVAVKRLKRTAFFQRRTHSGGLGIPRQASIPKGCSTRLSWPTCSKLAASKSSCATCFARCPFDCSTTSAFGRSTSGYSPRDRISFSLRVNQQVDPLTDGRGVVPRRGKLSLAHCKWTNLR